MADKKPQPDETPESVKEQIEQLEHLPTDELVAELKDYLEASGMLEAFTPRIHVTFTQRLEDAAEDDSVSRPLRVRLGPYLSVEISDGATDCHQMYATDAGDERDGGHTFVLATRDGSDWVLHDGAEGRRYAWVEFDTRPPGPWNPVGGKL